MLSLSALAARTKGLVPKVLRNNNNPIADVTMSAEEIESVVNSVNFLDIVGGKNGLKTTTVTVPSAPVFRIAEDGMVLSVTTCLRVTLTQKTK